MTNFLLKKEEEVWNSTNVEISPNLRVSEGRQQTLKQQQRFYSGKHGNFIYVRVHIAIVLYRYGI